MEEAESSIWIPLVDRREGWFRCHGRWRKYHLCKSGKEYGSCHYIAFLSKSEGQNRVYRKVRISNFLVETGGQDGYNIKVGRKRRTVRIMEDAG